jgi:hypothetical protein
LAGTKAQILESDGTWIDEHLLLKDLAFNPSTRIVLENNPYQRVGLTGTIHCSKVMLLHTYQVQNRWMVTD